MHARFSDNFFYKDTSWKFFFRFFGSLSNLFLFIALFTFGLFTLSYGIFENVKS
jgi:hypothetical protein